MDMPGEDFGDESKEEDEDEDDDFDGSDDEDTKMFRTAEKLYKQVLNDLEVKEETRVFAEPFVNLFDVLESMFKKEVDYRDKSFVLELDLNDNREKLDEAYRKAAVDAETINKFKTEVDTAYKLADSAHAREQTAQETIENLRSQVTRMSTELEQKSRQKDDEDQGMNKAKEGMEREKERFMSEISQLKQRLKNAMSYQEELERKNSMADNRIQEMTIKIEEQNNEVTRHIRTKEQIEEELRELTQESDKKQAEIDRMNGVIAMNDKQIAKLESQLKDQKNAYEKLTQEKDDLSTKLMKLSQDYDSLSVVLDKQTQEFQKTEKKLKSKERENKKLRAETGKMNKMRDNYEKRLLAAEKMRQQLDTDKGKLRGVIGTMERELEIYKKQADSDKRSIDELFREREFLNKSIKKAETICADQLKLVKIQEQSKRKLEQEMDMYMSENTKQRKIIEHLEKERDKFAAQALDLTDKIKESFEEMKLKQAEMFELKKSIAELHGKMRQQQNLFETVRAERNSLQKTLQESQAECTEVKHKLKVSSHQNEQLKEDTSAKEAHLLKQENVLKKVNKEKENLRVEVQTGLENLNKAKSDINALRQEEKRLNKVIMDSDNEIKRKTKELEVMMNERDIMGTQLVRRNDEISLLRQKINILQATLHKGEGQYDQRVDDIRLLKSEIKRLRLEKDLLTKSINNMTDLRQEVFHLQRDLVQEKLKCRALEEELQNPLNIHRWRKLEGCDPETYELLQKIQILQRRLMSLTSEDIEKDRQLKETQRLYLALRHIMAKQPGPNVQHDLIKTQRSLADKGNQMKCLVSELNLSETKIVEYKLDLEKVTKELREVKEKYYTVKKALEQKERAEVEQAKLSKTPETGGELRFTGGGFKMSSLKQTTPV